MFKESEAVVNLRRADAAVELVRGLDLEAPLVKIGVETVKKVKASSLSTLLGEGAGAFFIKCAARNMSNVARSMGDGSFDPMMVFDVMIESIALCPKVTGREVASAGIKAAHSDPDEMVETQVLGPPKTEPVEMRLKVGDNRKTNHEKNTLHGRADYQNLARG